MPTPNASTLRNIRIAVYSQWFITIRSSIRSIAYLLYTSMNTHIWITRIITGLISIVQASTMRERYYLQQQRVEILETALQDILRISVSHVDASERSRLIRAICDRTLDRD